MPSDVTHSPPVQRPPCLANHPRRITVAVVRHGACQTAMEGQGCGQDFQVFVLSTSLWTTTQYCLSKETQQMIQLRGPLRCSELGFSPAPSGRV